MDFWPWPEFYNLVNMQTCGTVTRKSCLSAITPNRCPALLARMGLLDIVTSSTDTITDTVAIGDLEDAIEVGTTAAVTGGTVAATGVTGGAAVVLPIAGKILLEEGVKDYMKGVGKKKGYEPLKDIAEKYDDEEAARISLGRACMGICKLADPIFEEDGAIEELARSDPERLNKVIQRTLTDEDAPEREELKQLEAKFSALFLGEEPDDNTDLDFDPDNPEALFEELKRLFGTEDPQEAVALFMLYEQFLADVTAEFTAGKCGQDLSEGEIAVLEQLRGTVEQMNDRIEGFSKMYLRLSVENQQFRQLLLRDFEAKDTFKDADKPPIVAWTTGYSFAELADRTADGQKYYFERPLPDDHELAFDTRGAETLSAALVKRLRNSGRGQNVVLLGEPGMGKSHLCKLAAYSWVDHGYGEVFYRSTDLQGEVTEIAELKQAIWDAQEDRDGHVLVVVEDAPRLESRFIFDVMNEFHNEQSNVDVTFLLDARSAEWERYKDKNNNYGNDPVLSDQSTFLVEYDVPQVTKADCANAINVFNKTTKGRYDGDASTLYDKVYAKETGRAELLALINTLIREGSFGENPPIVANANKVHKEIWESINLDSDTDRLYYEVVVGSMLLTAAEVGVPASLLYALAEDREDIEEIDYLLSGNSEMIQSRSESKPVPKELNEVFLFPSEDGTERYRSRHPTWAARFLTCEDHIENNSVSTLSYHRLFVEVVAKMVGLADEQKKRNGIKEHLSEEKGRKTTYLDRFDNDPAEEAARLLKTFYEFATREEIIAPLFDAPEPKGWSETTVFEDGIAVEAVPDVCSENLTFELLLVYANTFANWDSPSQNLQRKREFLQDLKTRAGETLEKPDQQRIVAEAQRQLGWTTAASDKVEWADVEVYYEKAIATYREIDELKEVAETQRQLAWVSADAYEVTWDEIKTRHQKAITTYRDKVNDLSEVAKTQRQLADVATNRSEVEWTETEGYYHEAITTYKKIGDLEETAWKQRDAVRKQRQLAKIAAEASEAGKAPVERIKSLSTHSLQTETVAELVQLTEEVNELRGLNTSIETVDHESYQQLVSAVLDILRETRWNHFSSSKGATEQLLAQQRSQLWSRCILLIKETLSRESTVDESRFVEELADQSCLNLTEFCLETIYENVRIDVDSSSFSNSQDNVVGILTTISLYRPAIVRQTIRQHNRQTPHLIVDLLKRSVDHGILEANAGHIDKQLGGSTEFLKQIGVESTQKRLVACNLWDPFLKMIVVISDANPVTIPLPDIDQDLKPLLSGQNTTDTTGIALFGLLRWKIGDEKSDSHEHPEIESETQGKSTPVLGMPLSAVHAGDTMPIEPLLWRFTFGLNPAVPTDHRDKYRYCQIDEIPTIIETHGYVGLRGLIQGKSTVNRHQVIDTVIDPLPKPPESDIWDAIQLLKRDLTPEHWNRVVNSVPDIETILNSDSMEIDVVRSVIHEGFKHCDPSFRQWFVEWCLEHVEPILSAEEGADPTPLLIIPFENQQFSKSARESIIESVAPHLNEDGWGAYHAATVLYRIDERAVEELPSRIRHDLLKTLERLFTESELPEYQLVGNRGSDSVLWMIATTQSESTARFKTVLPKVREQLGDEIPPDKIGYFFRDVLWLHYRSELSQCPVPLLSTQDIRESLVMIVTDESLSIKEKANFLKPLLEIHPEEMPIIHSIIYPIFGQFLAESFELIDINEWPDIPDLVLCAKQVSVKVRTILSTDQLLLLGLSTAAHCQKYASQAIVPALETALTDEVINRLRNEHPEAFAETRASLLDILSDPNEFESVKQSAGELLRGLPQN